LRSVRSATGRLLIVHPEPKLSTTLEEALSRRAAVVRRVHTVAEATRALTVEPVFPVVLISAHAGTGRISQLDEQLLDTISAIHRASAESQIILLVSDTVSVETCCRAIECGAGDFLEVSGGRVDEQALSRRIDQAMRRYERAVAAAASLHSHQHFDQAGIVAQSRLMADVLTRASQAAEISDAPVLIYGESGTGKQLLAEMIHRLDPKRGDQPFLTVNCAAITGTLAESAMFGHVKGAYTGATDKRAGYFRAANHGTIFLDEIGELEATLQPKLLRVLQEGLILPVGSDIEEPVDIRVLAASNRRLSDLVEEGSFRLDLYQRLYVISIEIPPLRERPEDIEELVPYFVRKYARQYGRDIAHVDRRVYQFLSTCALEGNVRELENAVRQIVAFKTSGDEILLADIPASLRRQCVKPTRPVVPRELVENACDLIDRGVITLPEFVAECERQVLANAIHRSTRPSADLAEKLGLSRRTLYNKRRRYDL